MPYMKVTTDQAGHELMMEAAKYQQVPLSIWARMVLLNEARSVAHKRMCTTPAATTKKKYKWNGKEVTREQYEAGVAKREAILAGLTPLPPEVEAEIKATKHRR